MQINISVDETLYVIWTKNIVSCYKVSPPKMLFNDGYMELLRLWIHMFVVFCMYNIILLVATVIPLVLGIVGCKLSIQFSISQAVAS